MQAEPTLADLFNAGLQNTNSVTDPFNNNLLTSYQGNSIGNPVLKPEVADTTGLGFVVAPQFFPGFNVSFDYYNIDISGAISSVSAQQTVDLCYQGNSIFCPLITRGVVNGTNQIIRITTYPLNFVVESARGYDIESSYTTPLDAINSNWGGNLTLRFLATHFLKNYTNTGLVPPTDTVGTVGASSLPSRRRRACAGSGLASAAPAMKSARSNVQPASSRNQRAAKARCSNAARGSLTPTTQS